jgi:hypothetical protein
MKKLFFTLAIMFACFAAFSQSNYKSAIGLRLGSPISVSYKQFISEPGAIEVFAGFRGYGSYSWFNVGGLYQYHKPFPNAEGLQWYFGGGAAAYFFNYDFDLPGEDDTNLSLAILLNLGLDYKFANAPVNLSLDWVPAIFIGGYLGGFGAGYGALSARYTLN